MRIHVSLVLVGVLTGSVGCGLGRDAGGPLRSQATPAEKPEQATPMWCDEWVENMTRCVTTKLNPPDRGPILDDIRQASEKWRRKAAAPRGWSVIELSCREAVLKARNELAGLCDWTPSADEDVASAAMTKLMVSVAGRDIPRIGVASCDEWMMKYSRCVDDKVPKAARMQMRSALQQTAATWKETASTPEGRMALENACQQMIVSTKQATESFGCEW